VYRAQGTCLLAANVVLLLGQLTALPKSLAGFEGHFKAGEREGKEKRRRGRKEREKTLLPPNKFLVGH